MLVVALFGFMLLGLTTLFHYEVLRGLSRGLPPLRIPHRAKLILVIFAAFLAHIVEIALYAIAISILVLYVGNGTLGGSGHFSLNTALYFSAETFSALGYGDMVPGGELRLLAGFEALNGLLLIGWSASYTYIAMERFWNHAYTHWLDVEETRHKWQ